VVRTSSEQQQLEKESYGFLICGDSEGKEEVFDSPVDSAWFLQAISGTRHRHLHCLTAEMMIQTVDDPDDPQVSFDSINVAWLGTTYDVTSGDGGT